MIIFNYMDDESLNLIFGIIFLFLIVNTMFLWSVISSNNEQFSSKINGGEVTYVVPQIISAGSGPDRFSIDLPDPVPSPGQTLQPTVNNREAAIADPPIVVTTTDPSSSAKIMASYLSIEMPEQPDIEVRPTLQPQIPQRDFGGFVTVYSLTNQNLSQVLPSVSMKLVKPPLVIDYIISPLNIVDIKYVEYKEIATVHKDTIVVNRSFEDAWFRVIVRDKDTGEVIEEDGFGKSYSMENKKQLVVRECGNYSVEFAGEHAAADLTMRVRDGAIAP
jgi:cell division protein FtsI/penicillin-binding protein 2